MKFLIIDGSSILNRSFYGIKILSNQKGQFTNAIYGFISTLEKLKEEIHPDSIAVAFVFLIQKFDFLFLSCYNYNILKFI